MKAKITIFAGPKPVVHHKREEYEATDYRDMLRFVTESIRVLAQENPEQIAVHIDRPYNGR